VVQGRIKRLLSLDRIRLQPLKATEQSLCGLCDRPIPPLLQDAHHLIPKSHGGKKTVLLHRICHRQIHAIFSETELARRLNSLECLRASEELQSFIKWVRSKPDDFSERTSKSHRLKFK